MHGKGWEMLICMRWSPASRLQWDARGRGSGRGSREEGSKERGGGDFPAVSGGWRAPEGEGKAGACRQRPHFKAATSLNNSLAGIEKGPTFHMDEAAVPAGPTGRNVLAQGSESAENGDPEVSALRAGGAALRAAPPAPRAATEGSPFSAVSKPWTRTIRPVGPVGTAAASLWKLRPF